MPTINASKYGYMSNSAQGSGAFATCRNASAASGTVINQPTITNQIPVQFSIGFSSKGDSAVLRRQWWAFDVSSYASGFTISDLQIQFKPTTNTGTNFPIAIVASTAQGNANSNLTQFDWNNLDFGTLYGGGSSTYWPDSNSVSTIDLNSTAVSAFSTGYLKLCILWYYDYSGAGSLVTTNSNAYQNFTYTPRITFSAAASGWTGGIINTVAVESNNQINTVGFSNIDSVNTVT